MTDAFSKFAVVIPIPDKEATTVAQGILDLWIYRFAPLDQIHSDGGKEFGQRTLHHPGHQTHQDYSSAPTVPCSSGEL